VVIPQPLDQLPATALVGGTIHKLLQVHHRTTLWPEESSRNSPDTVTRTTAAALVAVYSQPQHPEAADRETRLRSLHTRCPRLTVALRGPSLQEEVIRCRPFGCRPPRGACPPASSSGCGRLGERRVGGGSGYGFARRGTHICFHDATSTLHRLV
jgi:hypothetical protein